MSVTLANMVNEKATWNGLAGRCPLIAVPASSFTIRTLSLSLSLSLSLKMENLRHCYIDKGTLFVYNIHKQLSCNLRTIH